MVDEIKQPATEDKATYSEREITNYAPGVRMVNIKDGQFALAPGQTEKLSVTAKVYEDLMTNADFNGKGRPSTQDDAAELTKLRARVAELEGQIAAKGGSTDAVAAVATVSGAKAGTGGDATLTSGGTAKGGGVNR